MQFPYELDLAALGVTQRAAQVEFVLINIPVGDFVGGKLLLAHLLQKLFQLHAPRLGHQRSKNLADHFLEPHHRVLAKKISPNSSGS